jgi:hypothetical protein
MQSVQTLSGFSGLRLRKRPWLSGISILFDAFRLAQAELLAQRSRDAPWPQPPHRRLEVVEHLRFVEFTIVCGLRILNAPGYLDEKDRAS